MSEQETRFTLRVPDDLYAQLQEWAKREERSVHNLIIVTLRKAVSEHEARQTRRTIDGGDILGDNTQIPDLAAELELTPN